MLDRQAVTDDFGMRGLTQSCGMRDSYAVGCLGGTWGTHHGTRNFGYKNCTSVGSATSGFGFRGHDNWADGCFSIEDSSGFGQFNSTGDPPDGLTTGSRFTNMTVIDPKTYFISNSAGKMLVEDATLICNRADNDTSGMVLMTGTSTEITMIRSTMQLSAFILSAIFRTGAGTPAAPATRRIIVRDLHIDARNLDAATNLPALLSSDETDIDALGLEYQAKNVTVLGEEAFTMLSGMTSTTKFAAATRFGDITLTASSRVHNTITQTQLVPFVNGPINLGTYTFKGLESFHMRMLNDTAQSVPFAGAAMLTITSLAYAGTPKIIGMFYVRTSSGIVAILDKGWTLDDTNFIRDIEVVLVGNTGSPERLHHERARRQ